jgi:arylsulfatase A-like enzyme
LRKGYYAAVSFTDWNIGLTLDELERLGHKQDTIVALIGGALFAV